MIASWEHCFLTLLMDLRIVVIMTVYRTSSSYIDIANMKYFKDSKKKKTMTKKMTMKKKVKKMTKKMTMNKVKKRRSKPLTLRFSFSLLLFLSRQVLCVQCHVAKTSHENSG